MDRKMLRLLTHLLALQFEDKQIELLVFLKFPNKLIVESIGFTLIKLLR